MLGRRLARWAALALLVGAAGSGCTAPTPEPTMTTSPPAPSGSPSQAGEPVDQARTRAEAMTDAELVGQLLMPSVGLSDSPAAVAALVKRHRLGGVILMGNVENTSASATAGQVRALTAALRDAAQPAGSGLVPLIATDQEYGWVTRIKSGVVQLPSAMSFGAAARPDLTEAAWKGAGDELAAIGINLDFAPDADVLGSPPNDREPIT